MADKGAIAAAQWANTMVADKTARRTYASGEFRAADKDDSGTLDTKEARHATDWDTPVGGAGGGL